MTEKRSLEAQIEDCKVNEEFQRKDLDGNAYCILLFPEEHNKKCDCKYRGHLKEFHLQTPQNYTYHMSYYSCDIEIKKKRGRS